MMQSRQNRWLRPISIGVVTLIVGVSIGGCIALHRVVAEDQHRILKERGAAAEVLIDSLFQQELTSMTMLGKIAGTSPADAQRDFATGAHAAASEPTDAMGVVELRNGRLVLGASVGSAAAPAGTPVTGGLATLVSRGAASNGGVSRIMRVGSQTEVGLAVPVGANVVFAEIPVQPTKPLPTTIAPFDTLRGALYASPSASAGSLVLTTEKNLPLTGQVQVIQFFVGDTEWSLYFAAKGTLVGPWTATLPWLLLGAGIFLALVVALMFEALKRRQSYASSLVEVRTKSLAEANAKLDEARVFLRHLVAAGPIVVTVIDPDTLTASYVTPNISRLFGVSESEAMTPGFLTSRIDPSYLIEFRELTNLIAHGPADTYEALEFPIRLGGQENRWVSAVFVASQTEGSANRSVLIYALDVDERRRAVDTAEAAKAAADEANRSKSEFLSRMSHELRTPLNAILGYAQLFEMSELEADQVEPVHQILASGRHLLSLINEVLDISRIEVGSLALSPEPVAVNDVIQTTIDMIRPTADDNEIELTVAPGHLDAVVLGDLQRLRQVLLNLVSNAVKYNHTGGHVVIRCEPRPGDLIRISVVDDGPGISRDHHDLVFTPFERLSAGETKVEGTGMGLAVSRRLAEAMGTTIGIASDIGEGSTFWIDLPAGAAIDAPVTGAALPSQRETASDELPRRTVLLVEDNPANVRLVERIFGLVDDVRVVSTGYGGEAVDLAIREGASLVLLDLNLPDLSGERVLAALRGTPATRSVPVIVVSADATPGQIDRLLAAGATRYLTKPFDVQELLDVVDVVTATR